MKVGLILSGFLRTYKEAFSLLQKNVFDRYDTDLYLATWNKNENGTFIEDFEKIYSGCNIKSISINDIDIYNSLINKRLKTLYLFEKYY